MIFTWLRFNSLSPMPTGIENEQFETRLLALCDSVLIAQKGTRRVLLRTLLKQFGFKARTEDRITLLAKGMERFGLRAEPALQDCGREDWVTLYASREKEADLVILPKDTWDLGQNKLDFFAKCSTLNVWTKSLFKPNGTLFLHCSTKGPGGFGQLLKPRPSDGAASRLFQRSPA